MDVNDLRSLMTVVSFALFMGIMVWVFARRNKEDFEAAAQLPLDQD